jgi:hypothetical protein
MERSGHTVDVHGYRRPVYRSDAENRNALEVASVIAARLDSSVFQLIRNVGCREPETFGKRTPAFEIVRRNVAQPLPELVRTQCGLLCGEPRDYKANQKRRGHSLSRRHDRNNTRMLQERA